MNKLVSINDPTESETSIVKVPDNANMANPTPTSISGVFHEDIDIAFRTG